MAQKLKVNANPTFTAPAVMVDRGDMGDVIETPFTVRLRRLSTEALQDLARRYDAGIARAAAAGSGVAPDPKHADVPPLEDGTVIEIALAGWDGLQAEDGQPFLYDADNLAAASAEWPQFQGAIVRAAFKAYFGLDLPQAIAKNSAPQPATS